MRVHRSLRAMALAVALAIGSSLIPASALADDTTTAALTADVSAPSPTISGIPSVGQRQTADPGVWPDGTVLTYQWFAGTTPIANATATTYYATLLQQGYQLYVEVTGLLPDGTTLTVASDPTPRLGRLGTAKLTGEARTGGTLTVTPDNNWTIGAVFSYDWYADGEPIVDAHENTFMPDASLEGKQLTVRVTATSTGYPVLSRTMPPTRPVMITSPPVIAGDPFVGQTLTVDTGVWSEGTTLSIRWYAGGWSVASGPSFTITPAQLGKQIFVIVTGSNPLDGTYSVGGRSTAAVQDASMTISGDVAVGSTVTAQGNGWNDGTTFTYQWMLDDVAIPGATASTFTIPAADEGHALRVRAAGTFNGATSALSSTPTGLIIRAGAPVFTSAAIVGRQLTVAPGSWSDGTTFSYDWYINGEHCIAYTGPSLVVDSTWTDQPITVSVTGTKPGFASVTRTTPVSRVVSIPKPKMFGDFSVFGTAEVDEGIWREGTTISYQWLRNGAALAGETHWWHDITLADENKNLTVRVTAKVPGYGTVTQTTTTLGRVTTSAIPWISGVRAVGSTLTAATAPWKTGTRYSYTWYQDGSVIPGATSSRLVLTSAQRSHSITVLVTGRLAGYATVTERSPGTARIALAPTPTISGTRAVGYRLTAKPGTWVSGTTFRYQWFASGRAITGATTSSIVLKTAQRGKTITVKVTGTKLHYATISRLSAKTATIR